MQTGIYPSRDTPGKYAEHKKTQTTKKKKRNKIGLTAAEKEEGRKTLPQVVHEMYAHHVAALSLQECRKTGIMTEWETWLTVSDVHAEGFGEQEGVCRLQSNRRKSAGLKRSASLYLPGEVLLMLTTQLMLYHLQMFLLGGGGGSSTSNPTQ